MYNAVKFLATLCEALQRVEPNSTFCISFCNVLSNVFGHCKLTAVHQAMFWETCLSTVLRDKLHKTLHSVIAPLIYYQSCKSTDWDWKYHACTVYLDFSPLQILYYTLLESPSVACSQFHSPKKNYLVISLTIFFNYRIPGNLNLWIEIEKYEQKHAS